MQHSIKIKALKYQKSLGSEPGSKADQAWHRVQQKYGLSKAESLELQSIAIAWMPF